MSGPLFIHPQALCESKQIGVGTRIWAFAHVLPGAVIGDDCNVCDHTFIENDVVIGNRVTIKCGVQLWDGVRVGDDAFIGPNATFTNDLHPRSKKYQAQVLQTTLGRGSSVGANATILPGVTIGPNAMVGAGAVVTRDIPANAIVVGNPARIIGYVDSRAEGGSGALETTAPTVGDPIAVRGVTRHTLKLVTDLRGSLSAGEFPAELPFVPKRYFIVFDVPSAEVRGEHAHRRCHQFLVCIRGGCSVMFDDGSRRQELRLDSPTMGLHLTPGVWGVQYKYTHDAVLLVLASEIYEAADYIRNYDEFLSFVRTARVQ